MSQSSDSNENEDQKEPIFDTNNSHDDKIREANKLREKIIEGVKKRLEELEIKWNPHPLLN